MLSALFNGAEVGYVLTIGVCVRGEQLPNTMHRKYLYNFNRNTHIYTMTPTSISGQLYQINDDYLLVVKLMVIFILWWGGICN